MKRYCPYGHDTLIVGRDSNTGCSECRRNYNRNYQEVHRRKLGKPIRIISSAVSRADYRLRAKYGITSADKKILLDQQNGKCAICDVPLENLSESSVDHCHLTGKIRGILFHKCNSGIGYLKDSVGILQKATDYLKK